MVLGTAAPDREAFTDGHRVTTFPTVAVVREMNAPPDRILQAWIDPRISSHWLFTSRSVRASCHFEESAPGSYTIVRHIGRRETLTHVSYQKIGQFRGLDFTYWKGRRTASGHSVKIGFDPAPGGCLLTLILDRLHQGDDRYLIRQWEGRLDALASILGPGL